MEFGVEVWGVLIGGIIVMGWYEFKWNDWICRVCFVDGFGVGEGGGV